MRFFMLESQTPCLRLINSSWSSLQVICSNSWVRNHTSHGSRNNLLFGRGNWNVISKLPLQRPVSSALNYIYSMMYRLALNTSWALGRMIGLCLPGYEVWGHAFSILWRFCHIFSGHTKRWNNAAHGSFLQIRFQPISSSQLEPALPAFTAPEPAVEQILWSFSHVEAPIQQCKVTVLQYYLKSSKHKPVTENLFL